MGPARRRAALGTCLAVMVAAAAAQAWPQEGVRQLGDWPCALPGIRETGRGPGHVDCGGSGRRARGAEHLLLGLRLDLNRADAEDLEALPGVGPALAQRVVADRTQRGGYQRVEDLTRVRGVGPRILERIRPWVTATP